MPTGRLHRRALHAPSRRADSAQAASSRAASSRAASSLRGIHRLWRAGIVLAATLSLLGLAPTASQADPEPTIAEVTDVVDALYLEAIAATETYNEARVKAEAARDALETLESNLDKLRAELDAAMQQAGAIAAAQYRSGGFGPTVQMLLSEDTADFLARVSQLEQVADHQAQTISNLDAAQQKFTEQERAIARETERLESFSADLEAAKVETEAKHKAAQELLAVLTEEERRRVAAEQAAREAAAAAAAAARVQAPPTDSGGDESGESGDEGGETSPAPPPPPPPPGGGSGRAEVAVDFALAQVGDSYSYGAAGPNSWDCSGLTMRAWGAAGVSLPHSSRLQSGLGTSVSSSQLQPGDLVFYYSPISHVAMYIGNGQVVHASRPGKPVGIAPVFSMPLTTIRRVG